MCDIGKNLRLARIRKKLTQDELAELLHVSRQTVSNYETGRSRPDVEMLLSISEKLETDVQLLLCGGDERPGRSREYWRLSAEFLSVLILGILLYLFRLWARAAGSALFVIAPSLLLWLAGVPILCLLLGWTLLHACEIFLGARSLRGSRACLLRRALWIFLAAYLILELPLALSCLRSTLRLLLSGPEAASGTPLSGFLPAWDAAALRMLRAPAWLAAAFVLLGGALQITLPERI